MSVIPLATAENPQLIIGLIPALNRYYQDLVWAIIRPGVIELAGLSEGEWTDFKVFRDVYGGSDQLYLIYANNSEDRFTPGINQPAFIEKLKTPDKDYIGFFILQLFDHSVHVFCGWVAPQYRNTGIADKCSKFIEEQVKVMGAEYLSTSVLPGYGEALTRRGYKKTTEVYRKKLK